MRTGVILLAPLLLNACFLFPSGAPSFSDTNIPDHLRQYQPHVPELPDLHPFGPVAALKAGDWARYRIVRPAGETVLLIGVVRIEETRAWIEVVEEGGVRRVSSRLVNARGVVERALFREIGPKGASDVAPQPVTQAPEAADPEPTEVTTESGERPVLGVPRAVTIVRAVFRDEALGRALTDETVWSKDVPGVFASREYGGLVKRANQREKSTVELLEAGSGYTALINDPR